MQVVLECQHKGSSDSFVRSPMLNKERMMLSH